MARIKKAFVPLKRKTGDQTTRLPLALKPSNSTTVTATVTTINHTNTTPTSFSTNQASTLTFIPSTSTIIPSSAKETKKTKSKSKVKIVNLKNDSKNSNTESDEEVDYDLDICIEESGGIEQFVDKPSMILYKKNMKNQVDLEKYILEHLSSYNTNICLFPGIKGTDELKKKINEFYRLNRKKSMGSTILFKGNTSKTTVTQQLLLKDGSLYLFVDGVMRSKTFRNKIKRVAFSSLHCDGGSGGFYGKNRGHNYVKRRIAPSTTYSQNKQSEDIDNEGENIDTENIKDSGSEKKIDSVVELGVNDEEVESSISDDEHEISEQKSSETTVATGGTKRGLINWKGGSKNCGTYLLCDKKEEVQECVNSILCYGRDHGTLLTGVQLKTLMDIQNVEITKDRANALVQLVSSSVDVVANPHFVPPTAKQPVYEYYGEDYELSLIYPTKPIPIPSKIVSKYKKEKDKKKKVDCVDVSGNEEQSPDTVMKNNDSEAYNDEDNNAVIEGNNDKLNEEDNINSADNEVVGKEEDKEFKRNNSVEGSNGVESDLENDPAINSNVLVEESVASDNTLQPSAHLKQAVNNNNNLGDNSADINSKKIQTQVKNVVTPSSSVVSETNFVITDSSNCRSSSQDALLSVVSANHLSSPIHNSKSTTSSSSQLLPLNSSTSPNNQKSSTDISCTNLSQHSNSSKKAMKTASRPKQKNNRGQITSKEHKQRSLALRSKMKKKQQPLSTVISPKRKQDDQQAHTASPTIPLKKKKLTNTGKTLGNYQVLTAALGKIKKKTATTSTTTTSPNNFQ